LTLNDLNELAHSTVAFAQHVRDALAKSRPPSIDEPVRQARPDSHLAGS
jgi:hypothetical protein